MKIERTKNKGAEVYTASLNDIMFFLMLFFLIISTMVTPMALRVVLPRSATSKQVTAKENIILSVSHDKRYWLNDKEISFADIEPSLVALTSGLPEGERPDVLLQADHTLDLQSVIKVIDIGNRNGVKMILFTEKE